MLPISHPQERNRANEIDDNVRNRKRRWQRDHYASSATGENVKGTLEPL
ncbi:hypothetical protein [Vibrio vulnificus]|nr:hypothetical protein [Vibrio vulnificus]